jgi:hypothetical protein
MTYITIPAQDRNFSGVIFSDLGYPFGYRIKGFIPADFLPLRVYPDTFVWICPLEGGFHPVGAVKTYHSGKPFSTQFTVVLRAVGVALNIHHHTIDEMDVYAARIVAHGAGIL